MNNTQQQEKDYFWFYIAGLVATVVVVLLMVRGSEHDKYATAESAISQDSSFSAYRSTDAYKDSALRK